MKFHKKDNSPDFSPKKYYHIKHNPSKSIIVTKRGCRLQRTNTRKALASNSESNGNPAKRQGCYTYPLFYITKKKHIFEALTPSSAATFARKPQQEGHQNHCIMSKFTIHWEQTNMSSLPDLDDTFLYAFSRGQNLIYIGMTYWQSVAARAKRSFKERELSAQGLSVWLGYIEPPVEIILTKEIVESVEGLLILRHDWQHNGMGQTKYTKRRPISVINKGFPLLKSRCYII